MQWIGPADSSGMPRTGRVPRGSRGRKNDGDPMHTLFVNDLDETIGIYWVSDAEKVTLLFELAPMTNSTIDTFVGHRFRLVLNGEVVKEVVIDGTLVHMTP